MAFNFRPRQGAFDFSPQKRVWQPNQTMKRDLEIYIGIDFGTTFSKVSFQVGDLEGSTKHSIKFGNKGVEEDYCLPSVLGYDPNSKELIFTQSPETMSGVVPVKYFKYSMIERGVPRDIDDLKEGRAFNDPQRLCSAFYLGHLIRKVKNVILEHRAVKDRYKSIRWYINMGVPVSDFAAKPKPIYDEALNVAWQLSELDELAQRCSIQALDEFYNKWLDHSTWSARLNTVPELYAEIIMFLQAKTTDSGFYGVVDIGGGTMDLALFKKRIDMYTRQTEIYCVAQDVSPIGYEMYRILNNQKEAEKRIRVSYCDSLEKGRNNHRREMEILFDRSGFLELFFMGGARNVKIYHEVIQRADQGYVKIWKGYPGCSESNILNFMRGQFSLEVKGSSRLIISQMLAQPFEKMPQLVGQEWNKGVRINGPIPSLQDLQDNLYGP